VARYFFNRAAWAVPVVLIIVLMCFLLTRLVPGDPVMAMVGDIPASPEYMEQIRAKYGLNEPVYLQALYYFGNLLRGDLGFSLSNQQPVLDLLGGRAVNTLMLVVPSLIIASFIGIGLGALALRRPGGRFDTALNALILLIDSVPVFWLGQMFIIIFAVRLDLLPVQGMFDIRAPSGGIARALDFLHHWVMPGTILILVSMISVARVARISMIEMSRQDFITTALAKGLTKREVLRLHILPNAMIPIVTVIGYNFGQVLISTVITEAVFGWPGIGSLFMAALTSRDYPVLQGLFLLAAITVVLANLMTDLVYALIDPRVSYER
jgi:ABC-type dipeptide/oligopeptide/nickel transport system permease component